MIINSSGMVPVTDYLKSKRSGNPCWGFGLSKLKVEGERVYLDSPVESYEAYIEKLKWLSKNRKLP